MTAFLQFAKLCDKVEGISATLEKVDLVATFIEDLDDHELSIAVNFIMGIGYPEGEIGVGPSILYDAISKAAGLGAEAISDMLRATGDSGLVAEMAVAKKKPLTLAAFAGSEELSIDEVYQRFLVVGRASGRGSQVAKAKNLQYLFSEAEPVEARYIARLAMEDLRIGVGEGSVRDAIARAFHQPASLVERGYSLTGDQGLVARYAREGRLEELDVALNRPIKMMLAQIGESIPSALGEGATAVEWKFDGARVQVHKENERVRIFSRRLEDVTASLPEISEVVLKKVRAKSAILDGEAVAIGEDGRPMPFQAILKRFRRKYDVARVAAKIPLRLNVFDLIYLDGKSTLDLPLRERRAMLVGVTDPEILADQVVSDDPKTVEKIYKEALEAGHEGIMLKKPDSLYAPGKRGKNWLKVKPVMESLDLVVVGARWGEGRRASLLGSYRLACINPVTGKLEDVGWVATGLTDDLLVELNEMFGDLVLTQVGMEVEILPHVVFEVAYEEIQKSPNYMSGYALRFPRFVAVRDDKSHEEADTLDRIEELYHLQRGRNS